MCKVLNNILTELKSEVKNKKKMLIAIDGSGGSGKSTFAELIKKEILSFDVIKMDDFYLPSAESINITIHDITGRWIRTVTSGVAPAGQHSFHWTPANLSSGVYLLRASTPHRSIIRRIILIN